MRPVREVAQDMGKVLPTMGTRAGIEGAAVTRGAEAIIIAEGGIVIDIEDFINKLNI